MKLKSVISYLLKLPLSGACFFMGMTLSGLLLPLTGMQVPAMPVGADANKVVLYYLGGSILLAFSLSFLSRNLPLRGIQRWGLLAVFTWAIGAVGMVLESALFMDTSAVSSTGSILFTLLNFILPSLTLAGAVSWLYPPSDLELPERLEIPTKTWIWKVGLALIAYPAVYFLFGLLVQPVVSSYYTADLFELALPTWRQLIPLQIARSALFLSVCFPMIRYWGQTKKALWLSLGMTFFCLTAFMAVITSYWFPWQLRLFHGLELLADSLVYTGVLVWLFFTQGKQTLKSALPGRKFLPVIYVLMLGLALLVGCGPAKTPVDHVYPATVFSVTYYTTAEGIKAELWVTNPGEEDFPGDNLMEGKMTLWKLNGQPRAGLDHFSLPTIKPGESYLVSTLEWELEPGPYFLTWGTPSYGGVLSVFSVESKDGSLVLGRSQSFRTKPIQFEPGIKSPGQIREFRFDADGGFFIYGESPLPDQNCIFPLLFSKEGLVEGFPAGECVQIVEGSWYLEVPASSEEDGIQLLEDQNYALMLFSNDPRIPPSEPFMIDLSGPIQR